MQIRPRKIAAYYYRLSEFAAQNPDKKLIIPRAPDARSKKLDYSFWNPAGVKESLQLISDLKLGME